MRNPLDGPACSARGCADGRASTSGTSTQAAVSEADPGFVDASPAAAVDRDLQLGSGSPAIDAGDPAILDADGSRSDLGAYGGPEAW